MASHAGVATHPARADETFQDVLDGIRADATLDIRGLWCPLPPLKTAKALEALQPGQVLEVLGTNPMGNRVAPWVARHLGHRLLGVVQDEAGFSRFYYRKV